MHQNLKLMETKQVKMPASEILEKNVKKILDNNKYNREKRTSDVRSLAQLARAMAITAPSLIHALKGNPRLDTIQKIADALNVPIASLFNVPQHIYGEVVIDGKVLHFHSMEELQEAIKPKSNDYRLM